MNRLYYFLGVMIPIPLFFNLDSLSFIVQLSSFSGYISGFGAPVPIGILTFVLVVSLSVFYIKGKIHAISISIEVLILIFFLMFFIVLSILNIGIIRTLMLLFPFWCMYFVTALTKNIRVYEKICSGYLVSFLFFILLHFFSTLYFTFNGVRESFLLFNSIFGIVIYQASVSYSAVLSYATVTLFILSLYKSDLSQKIPIYFFIFIILFLLSLGARKAVLLDVGILFLLLFSYNFVRAVRASIITKTSVMILFLFPALFALLLSAFRSNRSISLEGAVGQRVEPYNIFFSLMNNADLTQILIGHGGGWGGFSNIYVDMIYRLGVVGFLLYFTAFFIGLIIVRKKIKYLFNFDKSDYYFSIWFWFTILTIVLSNMFNMNLQLPYYSINLTMIMMTFLYRTKNVAYTDSIKPQQFKTTN